MQNTLFRKYKSILRKISDKKEIRNIILKKQTYLTDGIYYFCSNKSKKYIYLKSEKELKFIKKNVSLKKRALYVSKLINLYKHIFFRFKVKDINKNNFKGSLMMITRNNDIKIFDFKNNKVLVLCSDVNKYYKIKNRYQKFSLYFIMPKIIFNDEKNIYIEEYINFTSYELWQEKDRNKVINDILHIYYQYFYDQDKNNIIEIDIYELLNQFKLKIEHKELVEIISKIIIEDAQEIETWPVVDLHGDLGYHNILLKDNEFYFIDWEDSDKFIFTYDIFNYMYTAKNLNIYFNGEIDKKIAIIFEIFDMEFSKEKRLFYLAVFMMQRCIWEVGVNPNPKKIFDRAYSMMENYKYQNY